jgi:manganese/zinc/iron transport system substrate-binding protein
MGPGVDPHRYVATPGDVARLRKADLILYNGLHLEGKMGDLFEELEGRVRTVAVTKNLEPNKDLRAAEEGYETTHDPHVWFDVRLWAKCVDTVRDALIAADPAGADVYRANADRYRGELEALHREVVEKLAVVQPKSRRVLITAHDAFHYFGQAYDFEVRGLQGISTAADISTKDVDALAHFIGERRIPAIFGETSVPDRSIAAVQATVKRLYKFEVKLVEDKLFSDALGEPGTPAGTYVGMVRHNVDAIARALRP